MLLNYGLKSEAADKGVAKIFVKSAFEEQFTVATWPLKSLIENIEKIFQSNSNEIFLSEKFVVSGSC